MYSFSLVQVFKQARAGAPSIVFIDEIDCVVGKRGADKAKGIHERVLSTLLTEMDGIGVKLDQHQMTHTQKMEEGGDQTAYSDNVSER